MDGDPVLTVHQVAERLQVSEYTVRRWIKDKQLRASMLGGNKIGWRIADSELRRFMQERGL